MRRSPAMCDSIVEEWCTLAKAIQNVRVVKGHEPRVVSEQEMQQRGLGIAERTRQMSFPSGCAGVIGLQDRTVYRSVMDERKI